MDKKASMLAYNVVNEVLYSASQELEYAMRYMALLGNTEERERLETLKNEIEGVGARCSKKNFVTQCLYTRCDKCGVTDVDGRVCFRYADKADAIMELVKQEEQNDKTGENSD